jgi:hypothetical protein
MRAEVKPHNGTPTLFLDGTPVYANFNLLSPFDGDYRTPSLPVARKFGQLGIHLYSIDACGSEWPGPRPDNPDPFDFSTVGPRLQAVLDQNPNAHFLLRMGFEARWLPDKWWPRAYPDELELIGREGEDAGDIARLRQNPTDDRRITESYASLVWRQQVKELLRGYIAHLREIGLYDRVVAYQIAAGAAGEWVKGDSDMLAFTGDYSQPMRRHFQAWLREKYQHYVWLLRKAWDDPDVTFDTADVPSPKEQFNTRHGAFRDPTREQKCIDYFTCLAELTSDVLIDFCATVKAETGGDKLAGAFYGYLMDLAWNCNFFGFGHEAIDCATLQRCGHLGLSRVLDSPHVDFLVSPYTYAFRGVGGDGQSMQPSESCRLHGKLYLFEEDTLMHNRFEPDGRMQTIAHTLAIYKRNFAYCLTHGQGITWLQSSAYPEYAEIEAQADALHVQMQQIGAWALKLDRAPQAEIAVFLDDESYFYSSLRNDASLPGVFYQKVIDLPRIGAPHGVYLLQDLIEDRIPPFKLGIFLNAFRLDRTRREALASQLHRDGRTALWLYAPGYLYDDATSASIPPPRHGPVAPLHVQNMTDLTGFEFGRTEGPWPAHMHVINFRHVITRDVPQDLFWGTQRALSPIFHVDDAQAIALGQVITQMGRAQTGLAVKEFADWRSIYCATPNIPSPVLRGIARYSGVHLYNECGDVLHATPDLLSVHTTGGGPRTFKLPKHVEVVYDLFERREVARGVSEFQVTMQPASTQLWFTGQAKTLAPLLNP